MSLPHHRSITLHSCLCVVSLFACLSAPPACLPACLSCHPPNLSFYLSILYQFYIYIYCAATHLLLCEFTYRCSCTCTTPSSRKALDKNPKPLPTSRICSPAWTRERRLTRRSSRGPRKGHIRSGAFGFRGERIRFGEFGVWGLGWV